MNKASFSISGLLMIPYYNRWGEICYTTGEAFDHDPFEVQATSTSGSPVIFTDRLFVGYLYDAGGRFIYDGKNTLQAYVPEGQELFVREGMNPYEAWDEFNREAVRRNGFQSRRDIPLYRMIEYCTWVEQKACASPQRTVHQVLTESFVGEYLERIHKLGLPPGKMCMDSGWFDHHSQKGSGVVVQNERFSDLKRTTRLIENAGHVPGIWLDLGRVSPESQFFREYQGEVKLHTYFGKLASEENKQSKVFYQHVPGAAMERQFRDVFDRLIDAGFVKFKLDMLYGNKREMKEILRTAYEIAHQLRDDVEIEAHIPDLFVSRYSDVVRTNDVLISDGKPWKELMLAHWTVCHYSSPVRWLNLDHIGGNDPKVSEADFLESLRMYEGVPGLPVISLLPDRFSEAAQREVREQLIRYDANKMDDGFFRSIPRFIA